MTDEVAGAAAPRAATVVAARGLPWVWGLAALAILGASLLVGVLVGPVSLGAGGIVRSILWHLPFVGGGERLPPADEGILWQIRAPRVALAALVGAALASAGASYQGVFRNPLADPYLLGVAAGAGLGATIAIVYGGAAGSVVLPLAAFVGAAAAAALAYVLGRSAGLGRNAATLVLAGVTVASFLTAIQTFVQQQHSDQLQEIFAWILGQLSTSGWHDVAILAPYVALSAAVLLLHRRLLDVMSVGDDEAASLGVHVARVRLAVVAAATIGTAAAVALSGLIGFVGIIVPHAIRLAVGSSYRIVLPLSVILGAAFLVLADALSRTILAPAELPIGVVTAFFGAPFFAIVLRSAR